jgi:hypothetical protein
LRSRSQRINNTIIVGNFEVTKIIMGATAGDPNEGGGGAEDGVEDAPSSVGGSRPNYVSIEKVSQQIMLVKISPTM